MQENGSFNTLASDLSGSTNTSAIASIVEPDTIKIQIKNNMREQLKFTIKEMHELMLAEKKKKELEMLEQQKQENIEKRRAEKLRKEKEKLMKEQAYWDSLDPKIAKKLKYEKQREADALMRAKTSRQRQKLYKLIQSDQISVLFSMQAGMNNLKSAVSSKLEHDENAPRGLDDDQSQSKLLENAKFIDILEDSDEEPEEKDEDDDLEENSSMAGSSITSAMPAMPL